MYYYDAHGTCSGGRCRCDAGFSGSRCDTRDLCFGISCGAHGSCSAGVCACEPSFSGERCVDEAATEGAAVPEQRVSGVKRQRT